MRNSATGSRPGRPLIVVKLGGSLAGARDLPAWLDVLQGGAGRIVLVPGGGPFADRVCAAQRDMGFDDRIAHHLALLAMEQFGRALAGLAPGLVPAGSLRAIKDGLRQATVPVWLPTRMVLDRPEIPESWDVTSDSLALWLAGRLAARDLVLIKSAAPPAAARDVATLSRIGLVDAAFPAFLVRCSCRAWIAGPADRERVAAALAGQGEPGTQITLSAPGSDRAGSPPRR